MVGGSRALRAVAGRASVLEAESSERGSLAGAALVVAAAAEVTKAMAAV